MFELKFRVLIQHLDEAVINMKSLLNKEGIKNIRFERVIDIK